MVIGDPSIDANVAAVQSTDPSSNAAGIVVRDVNTSAIVGKFSSVLSTVNSSTATLVNGAVFTGTSEEVKDYAVIQINVFADQVSATDGLSIQQSSNGTNWDITDVYTIPASTGKTFSVQVAARYFRIVYTNGGSSQGAFRLQSIFHTFAPKGSSQRPQDALSNENDFEQVSAFLHGFNGLTWDRVRVGSGVSNDALRVVQATDVASSMNIAAVGTTQTLSVYLPDTGHTLGKVDAGAGTFTVKLDPGYTLGNIGTVATVTTLTTVTGIDRVRVLVDGTLTTVTGLDRVRNVVDGTLTTVTGLDRVRNVVDGTLSTVSRVSNIVDGTLSVVTTVGRVNNIVAGTVTITGTQSSLAVFLDPGHLLGSVTANAGTGTMTVAFDPGHELGTIRGNSNTLTVFLPDTGHELGSIKQINSTVSVAFSPAKPIVLSDIEATSKVFTVSGTTSTAGNNTLVSPSASYNFKIFAYSLQTTGIVSSAPRFTTGASAGATELWRPLINAVQTTSTPVGANLAVSPPGFLFATGTNATLSLYLDTGSLMHYSVSFMKESA